MVKTTNAAENCRRGHQIMIYSSFNHQKPNINDTYLLLKVTASKFGDTDGRHNAESAAASERHHAEPPAIESAKSAMKGNCVNIAKGSFGIGCAVVDAAAVLAVAAAFGAGTTVALAPRDGPVSIIEMR